MRIRRMIILHVLFLVFMGGAFLGDAEVSGVLPQHAAPASPSEVGSARLRVSQSHDCGYVVWTRIEVVRGNCNHASRGASQLSVIRLYVRGTAGVTRSLHNIALLLSRCLPAG